MAANDNATGGAAATDSNSGSLSLLERAISRIEGYPGLERRAPRRSAGQAQEKPGVSCGDRAVKQFTRASLIASGRESPSSEVREE